MPIFCGGEYELAPLFLIIMYKNSVHCRFLWIQKKRNVFFLAARLTRALCHRFSVPTSPSFEYNLILLLCRENENVWGASLNIHSLFSTVFALFKHSRMRIQLENHNKLSARISLTCYIIIHATSLSLHKKPIPCSNVNKRFIRFYAETLNEWAGKPVNTREYTEM